MGESADRSVTRVLGARDRLVRDGAGRYARLLSREPSAASGADRHTESTRARDRKVSGPEGWPLVPGARQTERKGKLLRSFRGMHVRLRIGEGSAPRLPAGTLFVSCAERLPRNSESLHQD